MTARITWCLVCRARGPWRSGRCPEHEHDRTPARAARKAALYGPEHRADRRAWQPVVEAGIECAICGTGPLDPTRWTLDHRTGRPTHPACNSRQGATIERPPTAPVSLSQ